MIKMIGVEEVAIAKYLTKSNLMYKAKLVTGFSRKLPFRYNNISGWEAGMRERKLKIWLWRLFPELSSAGINGTTEVNLLVLPPIELDNGEALIRKYFGHDKMSWNQMVIIKCPYIVAFLRTRHVALRCCHSQSHILRLWLTPFCHLKNLPTKL